MMSSILVALMILLASIIGPAGSALAFTEDETIRILVGSSPGGGHDLESRLVARWIGKYLPGKPKAIIVANMSGAGGMIMSNYMQNRAKRDGLTWGLIGVNHLGNQALAKPKPQYDVTKMAYLFATRGPDVTVASQSVKAGKPSDIVNVDPTTIAIAGQNLTNPPFLKDLLSLDMLGIKGYKTALGYRGFADMARAFMNGEISIVSGSIHHAISPSGRLYAPIQEKEAYPLWQTGVMDVEGRVLPAPGTDIPTFEEVYTTVKGKAPSGGAWEAYKLLGPNLRTLNRGIAVPPGVSAEKVAILREAFRKLYADKEFIKAWEKAFGLKVDFISGEDAQKIANRLLTPAPGWDYLENEYVPMKKAGG